MKWTSSVVCFWASLVLLQFHGCLGCLQQERIALLEFKSSVNWSTDAVPLLNSWVGDRGSDCCAWERVKCNRTTGRVIHLSLNDTRDTRDSDYEDNWVLNVTLFLPFEDLQRLDLSDNGINGWLNNEGFEILSKLKNLEILYLDGNRFNSSIIPSLGALTSLKSLSLSGSLQEVSLVNQDPNIWSRLNKLEHLDLSFNYLSDLQFLGSLSSLRSLNLAVNSMDGQLFPKGFEILSKLKNLEILYLDYNRFNSSIIPSLGALTSLKTLSLSGSLQEGSLVNQDSNISWSRLTKLEHLDLSWNYLNQSNLEFLGSLSSLRSLSLIASSLEGPLFTQVLANLSNLEILDLTFNEFIGSIPPSIVALTSLKALSLAENNLNSSVSIPGLCQLKNLQELDLSANNYEGILPSCLNNLTSLRFLDLSYNFFKGNVPTSLISSLTSLEYFSIRRNHFEGTFFFSSFANHSKLEVVDLTSDDNKLEVQTDYPPWVPLFQLKVLRLSNCHLNNPTSTIPKFLFNQFDLREIDLSHNNLKGSFPLWLFKNNTRLKMLNLRDNAITGHFHLQYRVGTLWIDVSNNHIEGKLPENIGLIFSNLNFLNMSKNRIEGSIPSSIGDMRKLRYLDLSNNNFSGEMPEHLAIGCISLKVLKLSNNRLQDQLFSTYFNLPFLNFLHLDNNQFLGNILNGISKCEKLYSLDIGNNNIQGRIPSKIGNLTSLSELILRDNVFEGHIPMELCKLDSIQFLDLSQNNLSGSIPSCLNSSPSLKYMHLQENRLTGSIPNSFLNHSSLITLDIRNNNLSGRIPNSIVSLSNLRVLLLKGNHFHGPIPIHLCQLSMIGIMDLSNNFFYGSIPRCFNNFTFGRIKGREHDFGEAGYDDFGQIRASDLYKYNSLLGGYTGFFSIYEKIREDEEVSLLTKNHASSYKGYIINFMFGVDLSCNNLTGDIPYELGDLSGIRALNLSHNQLTGSIPKTLSKLNQIESLDLSHNNLSGEIPSELIGLNFLAVFTVANNNLSGRTPDMKAQFATFEGTSYEGNPFLCGPPLQKNCIHIVESTFTSTTPSNEVRDKYGIDFVSFFASFIASYITCLLGFAVILYINPYWRRMWLDLIDACIMSCFYFVSDTFNKLSSYLYR